MEKLHEKYGDRVDFYLVYVAEGHPNDYLPESNDLEDRAERAEMLCAEYQLSIPVLLDDARNSVADAYHVFNDRVVLIEKGRIVFFNENKDDPEWPDFQMANKLGLAIANLLGSQSSQLLVNGG